MSNHETSNYHTQVSKHASIILIMVELKQMHHGHFNVEILSQVDFECNAFK